MYKFLKRLTIWLFVWMVFFSIVNKLKANDLTLSFTNTDGGTVFITQDGIDNYINSNVSNFDNGDFKIEQNGNNNSVNLTLDGLSSDGSWLNIYQTGNSQNYSADLWCEAAWCGLTVNQP